MQLAAGLWLAALSRDRFDDWIDATVLPALTVQTSDEVLDRDGDLLRAYTVADGRWRLAVDPAQVDPFFVTLLLAYEDKRFYQHGGVDPRALARAACQAVTTGHVVSGGSTLTMQVARLLEDSGTGRLAGKLRQMRVAWALERRLTKDQILALYLHLAPYGGNVEGIRAASLAYFGKEPRRLTPAEAALLVAIPQSPETRRPDRAAANATAARARVLARAIARRSDRRRSGPSRRNRTGADRAPPLSGPCPASGRPGDRRRTPARATKPRWTVTCRPAWNVWPPIPWPVRASGCRSPSWWPITARARSSPRSGRPPTGPISGRALSI